MTRTMVVWVSGERYVFREEEIEHVMQATERADTIPEAWDRLIECGRAKKGHNRNQGD